MSSLIYISLLKELSHLGRIFSYKHLAPTELLMLTSYV
jgi:hypothetical protein